MLGYYAKRMAALVLPDPAYATLTFLKNHRRLPRNPPVIFNEHLCHLKGSGELARYRRFVDKIAVRDHVAETVGARYLVPLHGTAKRLTREAWESLPRSFVLKPNHGSGWHRVVRDRDGEDFTAVRTLADRWLRQNFYYVRREQQYRHIDPRLLFEELLDGGDGVAPAEYKFFCFHGRVAYVLAVQPDGIGARGCYDRDWIRLDVMTAQPGTGDLPRPGCYDEMLGLAETLARDFTFVRVDLYAVGRAPYFSELTFVPGGGGWVYRPEPFSEALGRLWAGEDADLTRFRFAS